MSGGRTGRCAAAARSCGAGAPGRPARIARRAARNCGGRCRGRARRREALELLARQGTAQVRERPARLEDDRLVLVDVLHQERARLERREQSLRRLAVEAALRARRRAFEPSSRRALSRSVCSRPMNQCRRWPGPCSRGRPGSAWPGRRRRRTRAPASSTSGAAPSTADSRRAGSSPRSRPCRSVRAATPCRAGGAPSRAPG
jgi:hypothetical protein